jgi:hypothetical protein
MPSLLHWLRNWRRFEVLFDTQVGDRAETVTRIADTSEDFISQVERGINAPSFETVERWLLPWTPT